MFTNIVILILAYLLGSIPTALIVVRLTGHVDIRTVGDGNMGARNVARIIGFRYAVLVAALDIGKGALAVMLAKSYELELGWLMAAGVLATLGHDFPIFAGFKGGQGFAPITGVLWVLLPLEISIGFVVYLLILATLRKSSLGGGIGMGLSVLLAVLLQRPFALIIYAALIILSVPAKQALDAPRRHHIQAENGPIENHSHR